MLALAKHLMLLVCAFANIFKLLKNDLTHQVPLALRAHQSFLQALCSLARQLTAQWKDETVT